MNDRRKLSPRARATLKRRVLAASRRLIAAGVVPSEHRLSLALGAGTHVLLALRNELRAEGLLGWEHLRRHPGDRPGKEAIGSLTGETDAERAEIARVQAEIRAAKAARGEPVREDRPASFRPRHVYRVSFEEPS